MRVDGAVGHERIVGIALLHELLSGLHVSGTAGERAQHHELGHRQRDQLVAPAGRVSGEIEGQVADLLELFLVFLWGLSVERCSPEQDLDPREQFSHAERFAQGVGGSELEAWLADLGNLRYELVGDTLPKVDFENRGLETKVFRLGGDIKRFYQRLDRRRSA